jgi:hypothetical protein
MSRSLPVRQPLRQALAAAVICLAASTPVLADEQSDRVQALEKKLESSLDLIRMLSARVAELERARPASASLPTTTTAAPPVATGPAVATAPSPAAVDTAQQIARLQDTVTQISESLSQRSADTGLPLHGFADVGAGWSRGLDPQKLRGFNGGTLDLYLTPQFGDRVKTLIELAVEYESHGSLSIDMERLQLGYTLSDSMTLWAGRFHTPFGLWNTSFHHGANLQTTITRPRFLDFEDKGGVIAAHSVGLWASGRTELGDGKVTYDAYVANGPSIRGRTLDFNGFTDDNANKLYGFNLGYKPRGLLTGMTAGVHGFTSRVTSLDAAGAAFSQNRLRMFGGYLGYDNDDWEVLGEYYGFRDADVATGGHTASQAWFVQVGKTFQQWTPFVRLERAQLDAGDRYFASQASGRSYRRVATGLRYEIDPRASLKVELSSTQEPATLLLDENGGLLPVAGGSYRRALFQYSVAF